MTMKPIPENFVPNENTDWKYIWHNWILTYEFKKKYKEHFLSFYEKTKFYTTTTAKGKDKIYIVYGTNGCWGGGCGENYIYGIARTKEEAFAMIEDYKLQCNGNDNSTSGTKIVETSIGEFDFYNKEIEVK